MLTIPLWIVLVAIAVSLFLGLIVGVIACYSKTPKIGDIIVIPDPETSETYLFLELSKPLEQMGKDLRDEKEVLATIRVKNSQ